MTRVAPRGPTYWRLDGRNGWYGADPSGEGLVAGAGGIELAPRPGAELDLADPAGTLGGLRPTVGVQMAADGTVFVLAPAGNVVRALRGGRFVPVLGGHDRPADARTLREAIDIAVAGDAVVCVDAGHHRVVEFGAHAGELRRIWEGPPAGGEPGEPSGADPSGWRPSAVAAGPCAAVVLDAAAGRVYWLPPGGRARTVVRGPGGRWTGIAVDRDGRIYLHDPERRVLDVYSAAGEFVDHAPAAAGVRDRFEPPPIRLRSGRFRLPARTLRRCDVPDEAAQWWFDRDGRQMEPADAGRLPRSFVSQGTWTSGFLESAIPRCQWDRVELDVDPLPPHTEITVWTAVLPDSRTPSVPDDAWTKAGTLTAEDAPSNAAAAPTSVDWPVRSDRGRRLAVRIRVRGTGYTSPLITAVRVHYPRRSAVDLLPAIFGADPEARDFLERFLGGMLRTWDDLRTDATGRVAWFDVDAVPGGEPLRELAQRLGVTWEAAWDDDRLRTWLRAHREVQRRRGTPEAVRRLIAAYLQTPGDDREPDEAAAYPQLVEVFRERNRALWGPGVVGRFRTGVYSTVGEARLVSTGRPDVDVFTASAHRFRVYVPESRLPTADDESALRRVIAAEAPAGTHADVCIVRPRLRVDGQSSVGLDTIIGDAPHGRLACAEPSAGDRPPLPPAARLGHDLVLGGVDLPLQVAGAPPTEAGVRIGAGTVIK